MRRGLPLLFLTLCSGFCCAAESKLTAPELAQLARSNPAGLQAAIVSTFDDKSLKAGTAWTGMGPEFFFAVEAGSQPQLFIDDAAGPVMQQVARTQLWFASAHVEPVATLHAFYYKIAGEKFGGRLDMPAFGPMSYARPGVPQGVLSPKIEHISKIYDGMKSNYWIYVPAQYDARTPAALMVFQDGSGYAHRDGDHPTLDAIDNLIADKKIPVMISIFIDPGDITDSPGTPTFKAVQAYSKKWSRTLQDSMRSTEYDTVSDRYPKYLRDEIIAEVAAKYNLRKDAYSHAIAGLSSGGICSFNAAWQMPEQFSRVLSWIGSFTSIQWKEDATVVDGGQDYPEKILREPHRNVRVWLQDGANDQENDRYGSWPLANIRMANALKLKGYDFHFSFGKGTHNASQGGAEFPASITWLWRDYDPAKTEQQYEIDPREKVEPVFRVSISNRTAE